MLLGTPVVIVPERWALARSVVAGRFVNAYSTNDWTLSLNFRARSVRSCPAFSCLAFWEELQVMRGWMNGWMAGMQIYNSGLSMYRYASPSPSAEGQA